jgi:hypothetical protein
MEFRIGDKVSIVDYPQYGIGCIIDIFPREYAAIKYYEVEFSSGDRTKIWDIDLKSELNALQKLKRRYGKQV